MEYHRAGVPALCHKFCYRLSASLSHSADTASDGIRQSPRGESVTVPTFGPSGRQERLNCCVEEAAHRRSSATSGWSRRHTRPPKRTCAQHGRSCAADSRSAAYSTGRSRAAHRGRPDPRSSGLISPSFGGSSSGRYRGIEHILQHVGQLIRRVRSASIGHKVAHQRFRDRGVHAVHTHVVAVVGRPAERQLGQVARADDHAAVSCWRGPSAPACASRA